MGCHQHHICQSKAIEIAETICKEHGYRFTESRRQIFEALISSHKALSAKELMKIIDNKQPPITYRALEFFTEVGLVHHIGSLNSYVACTHADDTNHVSQLFICKNCTDVKEINSGKLISCLSEKAKEANFTPLDTHIEVIGLCAECQH